MGSQTVRKPQCPGLPSAKTAQKFLSSDGEFVYDTVTGDLDDGAFSYYAGGNTVYYLMAYPTTPGDGQDDMHLAFDKDTDRMYWRADAGRPQ